MQSHQKQSCKIMQIMHITITIMIGSKNHEKCCMICRGIHNKRSKIMQNHAKWSCKILQIMHITITIMTSSKNHEKFCLICRGIHNKISKIMQNHAKWSCKILQIMHITITIMTGSKNHEKWCIIHGGVLLNLKLWWTLQPLKGKANNGGKTCFPRCSQIFFFDKTLFYHKMNHFKLKNPCGSLRQFFFPKRGKPKIANCTLCIFILQDIFLRAPPTCGSPV